MFFYFNPNYILFVMLPALALTLLARWWVQSAFQRASQIPNMQRITGAEAARRILDSAGLSYIPIQPTQPGGVRLQARATPTLDDHYDPTAKVLRLSPAVYS